MGPSRSRTVLLTAYLVSVLFFGLGLLGLVGHSAPAALAPGPKQRGPRLPLYLLLRRPAVLGFYENGPSTIGGVGSLGSLHAHARALTRVSPFWFSIGSAGSLVTDRAQPSVVSWAHAHGVSVEPLVNNQGAAMLLSASARARTVGTLAGLVMKRGYDGIFVDFELLPPSAREGLTTVITDLAARLHAKRKRVGVAVFPRLGVIGDLPVAYDYPKLGRVADDVMLMAYDAHYDSSPPGPVAPYPWVQSNLLYLLARVPRQHVVLGIGFYGYDWPIGSSGQTVDLRGALGTAARHGVSPAWQSASGEFTYRYRQAGSLHEVWFEGPRSVAEKAALARRYAIGGVGLWRLGFETDGTWKTLLSALASGRPT